MGKKFHFQKMLGWNWSRALALNPCFNAGFPQSAGIWILNLGKQEISPILIKLFFLVARSAR